MVARESALQQVSMFYNTDLFEQAGLQVATAKYLRWWPPRAEQNDRASWAAVRRRTEG